MLNFAITQAWNCGNSTISAQDALQPALTKTLKPEPLYSSTLVTALFFGALGKVSFWVGEAWSSFSGFARLRLKRACELSETEFGQKSPFCPRMLSVSSCAETTRHFVDPRMLSVSSLRRDYACFHKA